MSAQKSAAKFIVVLIDCGSEDDEQRMAQSLVRERLAGCVNVVPGVSSYFSWQGELRVESECLVIVKTMTELLPELRQRIAELHAYEIPEIIALPVAAGSEGYLRWLEEAVGS